MGRLRNSSTGSIACSNAPRDGYVRWSGVLIRKGAMVLVLLLACGAAGVFFGSGCPPASCPMRTRDTCTSTCSFPNAASLEAHVGGSATRWRRFSKTRRASSTPPPWWASVCSASPAPVTTRFFLVTLKPWEERKSRWRSSIQVIKAQLEPGAHDSARRDRLQLLAASDPRRRHLGRISVCAGGPRRQGRPEFLANNLNKFLAAARKRPEIGMVTTTYIPSVPQRVRACGQGEGAEAGRELSDVYDTIQAYMGGLFVNYFNDFGRAWQVYVEAEAPYRSNTGQRWTVLRAQQPGRDGAAFRADASSRRATALNSRCATTSTRSAQINGSAAPGYSSDQATAALEDVFHQTMPREMGFDYMGMSYQEQKAREGIPSSVIFGFSLLFVFLILAALYESWSLPFSVLLSTPVAVFGAFGAAVAAPRRAGPSSCRLTWCRSKTTFTRRSAW